MALFDYVVQWKVVLKPKDAQARIYSFTLGGFDEIEVEFIEDTEQGTTKMLFDRFLFIKGA